MEFEQDEHVDAIDEVNQWLNAEVIGLKPDSVFVHYTGWISSYDTWIPIDSGKVLK